MAFLCLITLLYTTACSYYKVDNPGEVVEVRLATGYRFWEVDYAALDFSDNAEMELVAIAPKTARDQNRMPQLAALQQDDGHYLYQPEPGHYTELRFAAAPVPDGQAQSLFLHVKGYYEHVREFTQEPEWAELLKFRQPGYFDQFSKAEYQRSLGLSASQAERPKLKP